MPNKTIYAVIMVLVILFSLTIFVGCGGQKNEPAPPAPAVETENETEKETGELVIYSDRKEKYVKPMITKFEEETGIKVKLLTGDESIVNKIMEEKNNVQADIFYSIDCGAMEYLKLQGLLEPFSCPKLSLIDERFRAQDGSWVGISSRSRVFMYNTDLISEQEMPKTMWELTDPKWKGQFMITRGGNGSMVGHIAVLKTVWGEEKTKQWIQAIAENAGAVCSGHAEIRQGVGSGEYKFGLVMDNYFYQQLQEDKDNHVGAIFPDQEPGGIGVAVNASGLCLIKGGPNTKNGKRFMEFMMEPENQKIYIDTNCEVPLNPEVKAPELDGLKTLDQYRIMDIPLYEIGSLWIDIRKLIEEAGLDLNV